MHIKFLVENEAHKKDSVSHRYKCHSVEDAISAIKRMDGRIRTVVVCESDRNSSLIIGGGNDGRYVVQVARGVDEELFTLVTSGELDDSDVLEVTCGGQAGWYPASQCNSLNDAIQACVYFSQTGNPSPALQWTHEK